MDITTLAAAMRYTENKVSGATGTGGGSYTLPTASANTLGGVKVGNGLTIDNNGVLSLNLSNGDEVSY